MKIKLYSVLSGDIHSISTVDFAGEVIDIDNVGGIVLEAKKLFKLRGKIFTVLADSKVFHVAEIYNKVEKKKSWKAYELKEKEDEQD